MTQTIGQKLKQAREAKHLTLEKAFEAIRIRVPYLQALEADDLSSMPSPVQARGYLRNYAEYLGLNFEQLLDEMRHVDAQNPSVEIIGPSDSNDPPTTQIPEPIPSQNTVTEGSIEAEAEPPVQEVAPLPPPKPFDQTQGRPARRKKGDSQPDVDSVQPPKRRGRKKVEPEPEPIPVVESQPEAIEGSAIQNTPQSVVEDVIEPQQEETHQPDVSDNLWQTWLNRLTSVISVRTKPTSLALDPDRLLPDVQSPDAQIQEQISVPQDQESTEIFKEIGIELRKRRELLSLHLDEVERNTRVKAHYLEALENGAMDDLPSTVQTRGMLSNYATFLDLDVDTLLLRFADALQARHRERNPQKPARKPGQPIISNIPSVRSFIAGDMIFGIGIAVLLVGFSVWGVSRVLTIQSERDVQPTAPSISDVLLASPDPSQFTATPELLPVGSIPGEATVTIVIPTQNLNVSVQVNLVAVERTFMRVTADGQEVFNGRVVPGNAYPFEAEEQVEVLVGSGAAIRIVYNGRDLGLLGSFGQVVNNIYRADEIITPTALPSPTLTSTVPPTSTVAPTSTVQPTSTPVPSNTVVP